MGGASLAFAWERGVLFALQVNHLDLVTRQFCVLPFGVSHMSSNIQQGLQPIGFTEKKSH
eukprot:5989629-Amphidinium_carterae.1